MIQESAQPAPQDYSRDQFADEVRGDRLLSLARVALVLTSIGAFLLLTVGLLSRTQIAFGFAPLGVLFFGSLITLRLKATSSYNLAAGFFLVSLFSALFLGMLAAESEGIIIVPFAMPVAVFIVGTLFPPGLTLLSALVASGLIALAHVVRQGEFAITVVEIGAMILCGFSAGIAALVTADLYQIAEWSVFNYARERRIAGELFDSRTELERSLNRTRALSEDLQKLNVQLDGARAAAEEAKHFRGQFLANMSHELRTPLNAIIGFSETMLKFPAMYDGVKLPQAYEADLSQIYTSGQELLKLINDILDLSKVDAGKLDVRIAPFDVVPLIHAVMTTSMGLVSKKPITLASDVPAELPMVMADDQRVRQVLFNLYSNAAKFTDSGTITVRARAEASHVAISVTDTGSGIDAKNHGLIFEEFKQAETEGRDPRSGAGLGLAISRQLLGLMGGTIGVESALGQGSTFTFTLPRADLGSATVQAVKPSLEVETVT